MRTEEEIKQEFQKRGLVLALCCEEDEAALYEIYQEVVTAGNGFPYEDSSEEEFRRHFFAKGSAVYVCRSVAEGILGDEGDRQERRATRLSREKCGGETPDGDARAPPLSPHYNHIRLK